MKVLLVCDPQETFIPELDTSVFLTAEIHSRGIEVDYCDISQMDYRLPSAEYLSKLRVAPVRSISKGASLAFELGAWREAKVSEYAGILQRKDPPVDDSYIGHCKAFMGASSSIIQLNHPSETWKYSEHLLPKSYPEISIPTHECVSLDEFMDHVRRLSQETVAKPQSQFGGNGISFFDQKTSDKDLRDYWARWGASPVIVQPFLKEITSIGDLRVLVMNGKLIGSVLRVPKAGSRLANLHQGASVRGFSITDAQKKAALRIADDLISKRLYLLGIDFIGEKVSEINITCPSAVPQMNQVMGIQGEVVIVDEFLSLMARHG